MLIRLHVLIALHLVCHYCIKNLRLQLLFQLVKIFSYASNLYLPVTFVVIASVITLQEGSPVQEK